MPDTAEEISRHSATEFAVPVIDRAPPIASERSHLSDRIWPPSPACPGAALSWSCDSRRPYLPDPYLRVPDERARFRTPGRPARRGGGPARWRRRNPRPGRVQHLRGPGERGRPAVRQPRAPAAAKEERHADRGGPPPGPD